jgi:Protein of unknown function (DUF3147)
MKGALLPAVLLDLIMRFLIGGAIVSLFSVLGDLFKPRSFAGLFGAAPSVALATLALTFHNDGRPYVTAESHAMLLGAVALGIYAWAVCQWLTRGKSKALAVASATVPLWLAVAFALWGVVFH